MSDASSHSQDVNDVQRRLDDPQGFVRLLIDVKARQLVRRPEFRGMDWRDLAQDLFADLWARAPKYDPSRALFTTFLFRVLERECADLIERAQAQKRRGRRQEMPLGDQSVKNDRKYCHRGVSAHDFRSEFECSHDVAEALKSLSPHLRARCAQLQQLSPTAVAQTLGIPLTGWSPT